MTQRLFIVDVFAERPYAGNPLAVVVGGELLADETMQQVAAEMNYSETTFVLPEPEEDGGCRVRLFTPAREIVFAGHPILGTAWVLRRFVAPHASGPVRLNLAVGQVPVTFEPSAEGGEVAWFVAAFLGAYLLEHRVFPASDLSLRIEQGYEIRRPSLVRLRARRVDGSCEASVGGSVAPTVRGELLQGSSAPRPDHG